MLPTGEITVDQASNTVLSFIDSGSPSESYETIILVHGNSFSNAVFKRLVSRSKEYNIRIMALNRRGYAGIAFTLAAIANVDSDSISDETRKRLNAHLRAHILLEPAVITIGLNLPKDFWAPTHDPLIPASARASLFIHLITCYYDYDKETISARDQAGILSTVAPSPSRIPSMFTFTDEERTEIVTPLPQDMHFSHVLQEPLREWYLKACFDEKLRSSLALKNMTVWHVSGDRSYPFIWPAYWLVQEDDRKAGQGESGRFVRFKLMEGCNHFMHWDEPDKTMSTFKDIFNSSYT
ncbi:Esterase lipase thioesterase [Lentinula edodes]|uniref:Esterase lipase thioesterase n=1 Tax=Lentinula edodes TaxID=5353 RepID=A0A1Q3E844_LENED|nr:Esterase lipase thioesterase [Lentinula edodes]